MELTKEEVVTRDYMFNVFIPSLEEMLNEYNPEGFKKWGYNACRQSAVFGACVLNKTLPSYEWFVWEGEMDDTVQGKPCSYVHAWIFGKSVKTGRKLLIDLSRNHHERLFIPVTANGYPKDHGEYKHMTVKSREQLNWRQMIEVDREYYTELPGKEFMSILMKYLTRNGILYLTQLGK